MNTKKTSAKNTKKTSAKNTKKTSAKNTKKASAKNTKKTSAKNTKKASWTQKTLPTKRSVEAFLKSVTERRREEAYVLLKLFEDATNEKPVMWGPSIIGFGSYQYMYPSGHSGSHCVTGFSPRKAAHSIYIMDGFQKYEDDLLKLGKHKRSVGCLYILRLSDVSLSALKKIVRKSYAHMKRTNHV